MQETSATWAWGLILASDPHLLLMVRARPIVLAAARRHADDVGRLSLIGHSCPRCSSREAAVNVHRLLGFIFISASRFEHRADDDYAQELRRTKGSAAEAIRKAAAVRVRPGDVTALAGFFRD